MSQQTQDALISFGWHCLVLLLMWVVLYLLYRQVHRVVERMVANAMRARVAVPGIDPEPPEETAKRIATVEELVTKMLHAGIVLTAVLLVFAVFDIWPALAAFGLIGAAVTLAGQSVILDYIMGVLILVEAQYYKGDWIQTAGVEGEVQEVGLRRTVLRDGDGAVHSVSNGLIRNVSNMTRIFAVMRVDVLGVSGNELEAAIAVIDRVGVEMVAEPAWGAMLLETPAYFQVSELTNLGATLRVRARVRPDARWTVAGELRRRLAVALAGAGIDSALSQRLAGTEASTATSALAAGGTAAGASHDPPSTMAPPPNS